MFEIITEKHRDALNDIFTVRHSVRSFSMNPPDKKDIEEIVRAGLIAPFASIPAGGRPDFRKLFVIRTSLDALEKVISSMKRLMPAYLEEMKEKSPSVSLPQINFNREGFMRFLSNAPYLIIGAEHKGYPPAYMADYSISLSYCMYNMWLKAVSLKIGFKLVSTLIHTKLGNDQEFCRFLGIPEGEYALDACVIGFPDEKYKPPQVKYPDYETNVKWL